MAQGQSKSNTPKKSTKKTVEKAESKKDEPPVVRITNDEEMTLKQFDQAELDKLLKGNTLKCKET